MEKLDYCGLYYILNIFCVILEGISKYFNFIANSNESLRSLPFCNFFILLQTTLSRKQANFNHLSNHNKDVFFIASKSCIFAV